MRVIRFAFPTLVAVAACTAGHPHVPKGDFQIALAPTSLVIHPGETVPVAVNLSRAISSNPGEVTLHLVSGPAGLSAVDTTVAPDLSSAIVSVTASLAIAQTASSLAVIEASDGEHLRSATLGLAVVGLPGAPDTSFGNGGVTLVNGSGGQSFAVLAARHRIDGSFLLAGTGTAGGVAGFAFARLDSFGLLDETVFPQTPWVVPVSTSSASFAALELFGDQSILAAGRVASVGSTAGNGVLMKLTQNGMPGTFGTGGRVIFDASGTGEDDGVRAVAILSDAAVFALGYATTGTHERLAFSKFHADGTFDASFGTGGRVLADVTAAGGEGRALIVSGNRVLVAATDPAHGLAVAKYKTGNGTLDATFGTAGIAHAIFGTTQFSPSAIAIGESGQILVAGSTLGTPDLFVVRFTPAGAIDTAFGANGLVLLDASGGADHGNVIAVQDDFRFFVAGATDGLVDRDAALIRFLPGGSLDASFGGNGIVAHDFGGDDEAFACVLEFGGKVTIAGTTGKSGFAARYWP